jgi:hypothetical protein
MPYVHPDGHRIMNGRDEHGAPLEGSDGGPFCKCDEPNDRKRDPRCKTCGLDVHHDQHSERWALRWAPDD